MAKIIYSVPVSELTGSIGGVTFQRNSSGFIARSKPNRKVNPSNFQSAAQMAVSSTINAWHNLPVESREGWNQLASDQPHVTPWGALRNLNGYQQFLSNNLNLKALNSTPISVAPIYDPPPAPDVFTVEFSQTQILINLGAPLPSPPLYVQVYATPPLRRSAVNIRRNNILLQNTIVLNPSVIDITGSYCDQFNINYENFISDSNCFIIIRLAFTNISTGFRSVFTSVATHFIHA
jgi:hypothetical protein